MNKPLHINDDRLMDLVNHLLPTEEEQHALSHLEECVECESRFRLVLTEHETAKAMPGPAAQADGKGMIALPRRRPRRLGAITLIAAAAVIAIVVYAPKHRALQHYWVPVGFDTSSLRSEDGIAGGSAAAFRAYEQRDAKKTIELLGTGPLPDDEMIASVQQLILASAYVNDGQPKAALYVLEKLEIFSLPMKWREQAQWVEYLALRDAGRKDEAHARLEKLSAQETEIGDRARSELKK